MKPNTTKNQYDIIKDEIEAMLQGMGVRFEIRLLGDSCPPFCDDAGKPGIGTFPRRTHIHGRHYQLYLERDVRDGWKHGPFSQKQFACIDFWNSYADAEREVYGCTKHGTNPYDVKIHCSVHPRCKVRVGDILSCVEWQVAPTFEEFCAEFGYDSDSRKAESVYRACQTQAAQLARTFTAKEREELEEKAREL